VMALPRQSTELILNLPSKDRCAIAYTDVDLYVRNNAQPVGCGELGRPRVELHPRNLTDCPYKSEASFFKNLTQSKRICVVPYKTQGRKTINT
jgi:hypothetical protein